MKEYIWKIIIDVIFLFSLSWRLLEGKTWNTLGLTQQLVYPLVLFFIILDLYDIIKKRECKKNNWNLVFYTVYILLFRVLCIKSLI